MTARIIIIEDEPIVALDLRRQIEDLGMIVAGVFADAEKAITATVSAPPDLALMDIRIRGSSDGLTAAEELYVCSRVPVVLVSAYGDHETVARACRAGAYAFVTKPFAPMALRAAIELTLAKHAEVRRLEQNGELLRAAAEHGTAAMVVTDDARRVAFVSPAGATLLATTSPAALDCDLGTLLAGLEPWAPYPALAAMPPGTTRPGRAMAGDREVSVVVTRTTAGTWWVWTFG